jgi:hypothetical protein
MLWFAQGSPSCRRPFRPPPSRSQQPQRPHRGAPERWDRLRAGLDLIIDQRGADMADLPGGSSGLLARGYKGKEADRLVTRIDPGAVSLVAELRAATSGRPPSVWARGTGPRGAPNTER